MFLRHAGRKRCVRNGMGGIKVGLRNENGTAAVDGVTKVGV